MKQKVAVGKYRVIGSPVVWVGTERFQLSHDGLFLKEGAAAVDICVLYCDKHTHAHTHTTGSEKKMQTTT